jgi:hypothetical protein
MDPYLEAPDIWPDFHDAFAGEIRAALNHSLPDPYYARLEMRPDVGVEIRDPTRGHRLVTLLEIASPSNKRPGPDRQAYLRKQSEVLGSDANLVELDLLRTGERLILDPSMRAAVEGYTPVPDYLVMIDRAWRRGEALRVCQVFSISLTELLPVIPIPLREGQEEVPLDLQHIFRCAYDNGPYHRGAVDYSQPPQPPLEGEAAAWAGKILRERGVGTSIKNRRQNEEQS